jgi:hypothetical protein
LGGLRSLAARVLGVAPPAGEDGTYAGPDSTTSFFRRIADEASASASRRLIHLPTVLGIFAMLLSLSLDAIINNSLEALLSRHRVPPALVILRVKSAGLCCAAVALLSSGALPAFAAYVAAHPALGVKMVLFALCGWVGESCLMAIVALWGAVVGTALASGRKMCTIVISMLVFPKRKGPLFLLGVAVVFAGVVAEVVAKAAGSSKKKLRDFAAAGCSAAVAGASAVGKTAFAAAPTASGFGGAEGAHAGARFGSRERSSGARQRKNW